MTHPEREPIPAPLTFEEVVSAACEVTLKDGYHAPTFIVDSLDQVIFVQLESFASTFDKRYQQMLLLGGDVAACSRVESVRSVFFVAEGWMSRPNSQRGPQPPPSQDPSRAEVLAISGFEMATRKIKTALFELLRDEGGLMHDLLDLRIGQDDADPADIPLLMAFVEGLSSE